jgi:bifunctional non-homologous end joining protein LigD
MLATSAKRPFSASGWLFELKYDGFRLLVLKEGKEVSLLTRNGNDLADRFPEIVADVKSLKGNLAIDGELVVADEHGHPSFYQLRRRAVAKSLSTIQRLSTEHSAQVMAFDILALTDNDVRRESLLVRKQLLRKALGKKKRQIAFVDYVEREGEVLFEVTNQLRLEGVMAKRCNSIYRAGKTTDWLKIKTAIGKEREAKRFEER